MPPTRGADGSKRVLLLLLWRTYKYQPWARGPQQFALRGLRALRTLLRAATVRAALIQGVLSTVRAAACNSVRGYPFQRTPSADPGEEVCLQPAKWFRTRARRRTCPPRTKRGPAAAAGAAACRENEAARRVASRARACRAVPRAARRAGALLQLHPRRLQCAAATRSGGGWRFGRARGWAAQSRWGVPPAGPPRQPRQAL